MDSENQPERKRPSGATTAYCPKCDFRDDSAEKTCLRCGTELFNVRHVRALSSVPFVIGVSILASAVLGYVTVLKVHAGRQVFRADDALMLKLSTGIFIVLGVAGLLVIATAVWQMKSGKYYGRLLRVLIACTAVIGMIMEIYFAYFHSR